jgi:hypothetical protein
MLPELPAVHCNSSIASFPVTMYLMLTLFQFGRTLKEFVTPQSGELIIGLRLSQLTSGCLMIIYSVLPVFFLQEEFV